MIVLGLVRHLQLEPGGLRTGGDGDRECLARDRDPGIRHVDLRKPRLERRVRVVRPPPPARREALGVDRDHGRRERESTRQLEHRLAPDHGHRVRWHRLGRDELVLRDGDLHVPVGTDLLARRVLVVAEHDRAIGGRDDEQADGKHEQERRGEARTGRSAEPAGREVGGQALGPGHGAVQTAEHPQQQTKRQEREREDQQRRRQQHQRIELIACARGLHRRAAQLDEREQGHRQDEQLDRHPRDQRAVLAREQSALLEDRPADVGQRQQQQRHRADGRSDRAEHERERRQPDREQHARKGGTVGVRGQRGQPHAEQQAERVRDDRREQRLHALCGEQLASGEPSAPQHRELERLTGQDERPDAGEDREGDGADLEHHEEDRNAEISHALLHERDERVESGRHLELRELGRRSELVGDPFDVPWDPFGALERNAHQVEVDVPHVLARHAEVGCDLQVPGAIHQPRRELGRLRWREGRLVAVPEGVGTLGRVEPTHQRERRLLARRADRGHGLADVDAEQARDATGKRDLTRSDGGLASVRQVLGRAVAEHDRQGERSGGIGPDQADRPAALRHDLVDRELGDRVLQLGVGRRVVERGVAVREEPDVPHRDRSGRGRRGQDRLARRVGVDRTRHQHADREGEGDHDRQTQQTLGEEPLQQEPQGRHDRTNAAVTGGESPDDTLGRRARDWLEHPFRDPQGTQQAAEQEHPRRTVPRSSSPPARPRSRPRCCSRRAARWCTTAGSDSAA